MESLFAAAAQAEEGQDSAGKQRGAAGFGDGLNAAVREVFRRGSEVGVSSEGRGCRCSQRGCAAVINDEITESLAVAQVQRCRVCDVRDGFADAERDVEIGDAAVGVEDSVILLAGEGERGCATVMSKQLVSMVPPVAWTFTVRPVSAGR